MQRLPGCIGLLLVVILAVRTVAADGNKGNATDQDYANLAQLHEITGKLRKVNPTDKSFTLEVDVPVLQVKGNQQQHLAREQERLLKEQEQILRSKNPVQRLQRMQHLLADMERAQSQGNGLHVINEHKDFDLDGTADAQVRRQDPPVQYDEKGNVKQYTAAELKELKGSNANVPGYTADWTDLKVGQTVKVTLHQPKQTDKDKDKDKDKEDRKPQATVLLIVKEAPENAKK